MFLEHEGRSPTVDLGAWIAPAAEATRRCAELLGRHRDDRIVG